MIALWRLRMGSLGLPEIIFILLLALLIFGPKRLPEIGRTLGKGMAEFRKASNDLKRTINAELALDEDEQSRLPRRIESPAVSSFVQAIQPPQDAASQAAPVAPVGTVAQTPATYAHPEAAPETPAAPAAAPASATWTDPTAPAPPEHAPTATTPIEPS